MTDPPDAVERWIADVASGRATMSQRGARWVERHGGIDAIVASARANGVHLLRLTDDKGAALIAASRTPFETLC